MDFTEFLLSKTNFSKLNYIMEQNKDTKDIFHFQIHIFFICICRMEVLNTLQKNLQLLKLTQ